METNSNESLVPIRVESAPLRSNIIEAIRGAIEHGILKPGSRLIEKDLCERLEVSRTSLREALRELEAEGIVARVSARGLTVVKISLHDAANIYRIRAQIEALIFQQFTENATDHGRPHPQKRAHGCQQSRSKEEPEPRTQPQIVSRSAAANNLWLQRGAQLTTTDC